MPDYIPDDGRRCQFLWSNGNRCRELRAEGEDHGFCRYHFARVERESRGVEPFPSWVGEEILPPNEKLDSASAVNGALTRVFRCVCEGRLSPRSAVQLGYVGQLIITTLPGLQRESTDRPKHAILGRDPDAAILHLADSLQHAMRGPAAARATPREEDGVPPVGEPPGEMGAADNP